MDMGRAAGRKPAASRVIKHRLLDFSLHGNCGEVFEMFRPRLIWLEITVDGDVPAITNAVVQEIDRGMQDTPFKTEWSPLIPIGINPIARSSLCRYLPHHILACPRFAPHVSVAERIMVPASLLDEGEGK